MPAEARRPSPQHDLARIARNAGLPWPEPSSPRPPRIVIANAVDSDPLSASRAALATAHPHQLVRGLYQVLEKCQALSGIIAVSLGRGEGIRATLRRFSGIELVEVESYYPAGDAAVLRAHLTGDAEDVQVLDARLLVGLEEAAEGRPHTHWPVTVGGAVQEPGVFLAPHGARAVDLVGAAGGATDGATVILAGNPVHGLRVQPGDSVPRNVAQLTVLTPGHPLLRHLSQPEAALAACDGCGACTWLCPASSAGLQPDRLATGAPQRAAVGCSGCRLCELVACPSRLPVLAALHAARSRHFHVSSAPARRVPRAELTRRAGLHSYRQPTGSFLSPIELSGFQIDLEGSSPEVAPQTRVRQRQRIAAARGRTPATFAPRAGLIAAANDAVVTLLAGD